MRQMPEMVIENYQQRQAACFSGVFPEIQHAWASVDNLLYVWDTTRSELHQSTSVNEALLTQSLCKSSQVAASVCCIHWHVALTTACVLWQSRHICNSDSQHFLEANMLLCTVCHSMLATYTLHVCRMSVPVPWQEQQAICLAGLTRPKPNIFKQSVEYIMVVCTTVEVHSSSSSRPVSHGPATSMCILFASACH